MRSILENVEPDLAKQLRTLSSIQSTQLLTDCCNFVASQVAIDAELAELITRCQSGDLTNDARNRVLVSYAEMADERYWELEHAGFDEEKWRPWFQRARLATAWSKTSGTRGWEEIADGLYELTVIFNERSVIVEFAKRRVAEVQA